MQLRKIQISVLSAALTALMCSSVVQASDLQIYAMPTAGQKTIVMMVDVSGSMAWTMGGSTTNNDSLKRITQLKNGIRAVLDSDDPKLENVVMGLGKFPRASGSKQGVILVPAAKLGAPARNGQPESAQRQALRWAVNNQLAAVGGTPTSHGYAEAASYLMGTRTNSYIEEQQADVYRENLQRTGNSSNRKYNECTSYSSNISRIGSYYYQECLNFSPITATAFEGKSYDFYTDQSNPRSYFIKTNIKTLIKVEKNQSNTSGFSNSVLDSKTTTNEIEHYKSPLPTNKVSCDGQGVYVLSDGEPNDSSDAAAQTQMINALSSPVLNPPDTNFSCNVSSSNLTNPLTGGNSGGAWKCMGEFAKRLYSGANPAGVKIQTAFVGYSNSFNNLSNDDVRNACKLGSNLKGDACSYYQADGLTLNLNATRRNPESGYGNGGFYTATSANDVTKSVLNFIDNLGTDPLSPLPTGALSVPIDALNPNGLQNVGYLRMLEPNPAQPSLLTWAGNLKKYTMKDGVLVDRNINIFDAIGNFATNTKNLWGSLLQNDGGLIQVGGTYEMLPMPTETKQSTLRNLVTDVKDVNGNILVPLETRDETTGTVTPTPLLRVPNLDTGISKNTVLNQFRSQSVLSQFPVSVRLKLLNYLGFKVDTALEELPENDEVSYEGSPYISMGGIIHSFPVQMTYSGVISSSGELLTQDIPLDDGNFVRARQQSVLYGSMEGGLHIVDSLTGEEQMVFVPAEILNDERASSALVQKGSGTPAPAHGVDAPWVVDATYRTSGTHPNAQVVATKMNVYGGLRMGGNSFYALDVLNPKKPKLKFRIGPDLSDFSRMGQSWSKPTLINLRINGKPKRAMVVGGGYDMCYENPRFKLASAATENDTDNCSTKTRAKGNAIYVVDADTGERLFWASNNDSDADNTHMKHSIVSRVSALDRDGDGFEDHLYFGDLGGQIFRIDLDNYHEKAGESFGVRTTRLANLATNTDGTSITNGDNPRFYEPVTLTIHDEQGSTSSKTFIVVGAASGDRSTPLDVAPTEGRDGLSPNIALSGRPVNKVYGIFDLDFINDSLITNRELTTDYTATTSEEDVPLSNRLLTRELTLKDLLSNPQVALTETNTAYSQYFNETAPKFGWYRSLSWSWDTTANGAELANGTFRKPGGLKAFEEPLAIGNNLFIPVYDPEGTGITPQDPCLPRVVGETDRQQYCLPFGVCVTDTGAIDIMREKKTGFRVERDGAGWKNANVIGKGIQGIALANNGGTTGNNSCGNFTLASNTSGIGNWQCTRKLNPTRWFEKR
ncbi:PilC/PilY family type IV pilus protein [Acinetobacter indicus]|uniref:PilC/PilY family type IV pilus protein n=1 Tax=Acinetobacter indicus TaxID=756892 RepID=UPI001363CC29|nr:PilC/PilY family type IV pilus protein [Acinetobacter indicus]